MTPKFHFLQSGVNFDSEKPVQAGSCKEVICNLVFQLIFCIIHLLNLNLSVQNSRCFYLQLVLDNIS